MNRQIDATVETFCAAMEAIAPRGLAQSWDNVGLLVGDPQANVRRVIASIDLTHPVVDEAIELKADLVLAYHPPIFKPFSSLRADGHGMEAVLFRCVRNGIAVYSTHTALDAAEGGTNDTIAALCGIRSTEPLEYVDEPGVDECKLVAFVPKQQVDKVAEAMFTAGAGRIGDYSRCSYRTAGQGTFHGGETTSPVVGERGRLEYVDEIRLETVVPAKTLPAVITALKTSHPYEEPAFDVYPLKPTPARGIGRVGMLHRPWKLERLARKLMRSTNASCTQVVGPPDRILHRALIAVGAAGTLPFRLPLLPNDVIITGEIRHHDALTIQRIGCTAIALGHWASERPVLKSLVERLLAALPGTDVHISAADKDPFNRP